VPEVGVASIAARPIDATLAMQMLLRSQFVTCEAHHMARKRIPERFQVWIDARKRHHLSHAHAQMARELGMNPQRLGKIDNADQEPWKVPLPRFIEELYEKRFGKTRPEVVLSMEERARLEARKKAPRREEKRRRAGLVARSAPQPGSVEES
jgi:hypothetical protein